MMHATLVLAVILAAVPAAGASGRDDTPTAPLAVGGLFPRLEAEFLTGRRAVLPDAAQGRVALVMMGFTYDSRFAVEKWAARFHDEYGSDGAVTFFEVPVIGGMGRLAKWFIDSGMRRGTAPELHEHVITVYSGADRWKAIMGFTKAQEDDAYLALLAPDGRVRWLHRGLFSEEAMAGLKAAISAAGLAATAR